MRRGGQDFRNTHRGETRTDSRVRERTGKRQRDLDRSPRKRFGPDTVPLDRRRSSTLWDEPDGAYVGVDARVLKIVTNSGSRQPLPAQSPDIIQKIQQTRALTPENSYELRLITVESQSKEEFTAYARKLFTETNLSIDECKRIREHIWLAPSPKHVAYLLAFPGQFVMRRPTGLVLSTNASDIFCDQRTKFMTSNNDATAMNSVSFEGSCVSFGFTEEGTALFVDPYIQKPFTLELPRPSQSSISPNATKMQIINALPIEKCSERDEAVIIEDIKGKLRALGTALDVYKEEFPKELLPRVIVSFKNSDDCSMAIRHLSEQSINGRRLITAPLLYRII